MRFWNSYAACATVWRFQGRGVTTKTDRSRQLHGRVAASGAPRAGRLDKHAVDGSVAPVLVLILCIAGATLGRVTHTVTQ